VLQKKHLFNGIQLVRSIAKLRTESIL